ncbi:MAG: hypothetical protein KAY97_02775 [Chromatiaceae bacterium]|nr:hypothetical protein [Chromatiaceae bacterium]
MRRFPHGGEVLGASPAHPLLAPVLRPEMVLSRQQALLDLQAIQRIPGLAGYWPADPAYLYEDSAGTIPANTNGTGVVGCWRRVGDAPVYTPVTINNPGFDTDTGWTKGTGWSIADGVATHVGPTSGNLSQAVSFAPGATYLITWTMTRTAGSIRPVFFGGTTISGDYISASGTYSENFTAVTGNTTLVFEATPDFAGTVDNVTLVSVSNAPALQATTAVKPYLRRTPTSNVTWLYSNTSTSALTATLGNIGSACTVARAGAEGVTFTEGVTISSTYNIAPAYGFNGDVAIFNRALTVTEKALVTRYMSRGVPVLGSNLVTNGDFENGTTGWATDDATLEIISGAAKVTTLVNYGRIFTPSLNLAVGGYYQMTGEVLEKGDSTYQSGIAISTSSNGGGLPVVSSYSALPGSFSIVFGAATATLYAVCANNSATAGQWSVFDNISVKAIL